MGLSGFFLPERLPRQILFGGDRHVEIFIPGEKKARRRERLALSALTETGDGDWQEIASRLLPVETGLILHADPFIFNFIEFDKLPWKRKALGELVAWKLQKIFPESMEAYEHRFFPLDRKRVLSILVSKALLEKFERAFQRIGIPLIYIGSSTMEIAGRLARAKPAPHFFIEHDSASCTLAFQKSGAPIYIRKFKTTSLTDTVEEIDKTVMFVRNNHGIEPRSYWLIDHQDGAADAAMQEMLAAGGFSRLDAGSNSVPYVPCGA